MAIPILSVDGSPMARKKPIKSLPPGRYVDNSQACNGLDTLSACRADRAENLFLRSAMPEMVRPGVLEAARQEGLIGYAIVVSADMQRIVRERTINQWSIPYLKKPMVNGESEAANHRCGVTP